MVSNYKKEPIFLLERTWDDSTKLPEKYKFQGTNTRNKAEVHIDSGTLGMEFFLAKDPILVQPGRNWTQLELVWVFLGVQEHPGQWILYHLAQGTL